MNKVAQVTIFFWILKILATTLGETAGDFLSMGLGLGYYVGFAVTFTALVILLSAQIQADRYRPILYWTAIVATTTAGTEISDLMDRSLGLGYVAGSLILVTGLLGVLTFWYYRDQDLSVYPIVKRKTETSYWLAIIFSNSLGTAFGDFLTDNAGLSYIQGALVTATVIGIVIALHYTTNLSEVLLFWIAFVFTRPFGATFGDFITKPIAKGGLELPQSDASLIAFVLMAIVLFVSIQSEKKHQKREDQTAHSGRLITDGTLSGSTPFNLRNPAESVTNNTLNFPIRVPAVTPYFWIIKVLATTVGETAADYLSITLQLGLSVTSNIVSGLLLAALFNQFKLRRYVPASYWLVVVLISVAGTLITDRLVDDFGVSLVTATVSFSIALALIFWVWFAYEKT